MPADRLAFELAQLLREPSSIAAIPMRERIQLAYQCASLASMLALAAFEQEQAQARENEDLCERILAPGEAAQRLGVSESWLRHHGTRLPFYRKNGKFAGFLESGMIAYMREPPPPEQEMTGRSNRVSASLLRKK